MLTKCKQANHNSFKIGTSNSRRGIFCFHICPIWISCKSILFSVILPFGSELQFSLMHYHRHHHQENCKNILEIKIKMLSIAMHAYYQAFLDPFYCIFRGDLNLKIEHFFYWCHECENFTCHSDGCSILQQWKLQMGKEKEVKGKIEIRVSF